MPRAAKNADLPSTAKRKVIKTREWESGEDRVVYLDELVRPSSPDREFDVYAEDGRKLGRIHSYKSSITTKIAGTRLVRNGRRRTFWSTGSEYWRYLESQSEAIRELLREEGSNG